ncbi:MAG: carboxypeptidase-like regulatory domain-containing protein, partial [Verrucomicrobiota bacterium]|nr:carboxypeptidase-like regulatory domain-containing protein [Verrucomicrobiota bacterium]
MLIRRKRLFIVTALVLLGFASVVRIGHAQKPTAIKTSAGSKAPLASSKAVVGHPVGFAETRPVRELMDAIAQTDRELQEEAETINELNTFFVRKPNPNAPPQKDGALQTSFGTDGRFQLNIPSPIVVFEGVGVNGSAPPDTVGAVGPNDYVQAVNGGGVQIFDKNGVPRGPAFKLSTLFAPLGGVAASNDNGDALVLYDRAANRWVLSQFAFASSATPPYHQPIAVSKTSDPTGAYWAYDFITPGNEFPDYGKIGSWPDGYYFTDRQFTNGVSYNGFGVFAFDRAKMLVGDSSASYIYFNAGPSLSNSSSGMIPTDYNGLTPPPAGPPNVFSVFLDDSSDDAVDALRLFDFHADFTVPGNSTFTERPESPLPVAAFDSRSPGTFTGARAEIEEPVPATSTDYLNAIGDRLMLRLQYFNRGGTELLTTVHTVNAGVIPPPGVGPTIAQYRAGTRYYILEKTSAGGNWSVQDQGTYSPDTTERWMGSSAVDNAGNLAVGYSTSSLSVFPSIAYAGRLLTDPPGMLSQGEATMFAGTGVQLETGNRWGDYTAMCLDPVDDATFWFTNEYYNTNATFAWKTKIGSFKFAGTTAPAQGTLSGTITACDSGAPLQDALIEVTGGPSTGFSAGSGPDGTYSMQLSPGAYSVTIIDPAHNCGGIGPFPVTITDGNTTTLDQCLTGTADFLYVANTIDIAGGNGNGIVEPNECNSLNVTILNDGCLLGSGISAQLSTTTPEVRISQRNSAYPDTAEGSTGTNTTPFQVSTSPSFACGTSIDFTLTVSFPGGSSVLNFSVETCQLLPTTVNGSLDVADPVQEGRLGRNAVVSDCGTAKACPGIFGDGNRRYDVLTFPNGPGAACATISTTATNATAGGAIVSVAYLNNYVPPVVGNTGNICINYLGDPGGSPAFNATNTFSVDVPANQTLVVVVEETNLAQTPGSTYTLQVSGLVGNGIGNGTCPSATPSPTPTPTISPSPTVTPSPSPTMTPSPSPSPSPSASPTPTPAARSQNISSRVDVGTGVNVAIAGFIIKGSAPKQVVIRGIGPSLTARGVTGALPNPVLELHDSSQATIASNNDWKDNSAADQTVLTDNGLAPTNDLESALVQSLAPGAYTAIVSGNNDTTGIGLVEVFDLDDSSVNGELANISTRGLVGTDAKVLIGGVIIGP